MDNACGYPNCTVLRYAIRHAHCDNGCCAYVNPDADSSLRCLQPRHLLVWPSDGALYAAGAKADSGQRSAERESSAAMSAPLPPCPLGEP